MTDIDCDVAQSPSPSKSDPTDLDEIRVHIVSASRLPQVCTNVTFANISSNSSVTEDDELGDGLRTGPSSLLAYKLNLPPPPTDSGPSSIQTEVSQTSASALERTSSLPWLAGERRRRKLPEIPKNKKCERKFANEVCAHYHHHSLIHCDASIFQLFSSHINCHSPTSFQDHN